MANHRAGEPAVANLSLTNEGGEDTVVEAAVARLINDGVTTVIAPESVRPADKSKFTVETWNSCTDSCEGMITARFVESVIEMPSSV